MTRFWLHILLFMIPALAGLSQKVTVIPIEGAINPVTASFLDEGIAKAAAAKSECLVIMLNTPGGLLKSTRMMVSSILESPVPVVVYVAPGGAHAGSAGVFITLAAHVAAMAPGTNIGAAHPVSLQGGMDSIMTDKATNDAAAFIRSIAGQRNRNLEWAEDAVRHSVSVAESEAVKKNIVDLVATNMTDLLQQIDGREVKTPAGTSKLQTRGARVEYLEMTWVNKLLHLISDPTIAYILMMLGIYGLIFEFYSPGIGIPGAVGGISLILAFYSMHTLPIHIAGLALIALAIILFILEVYTPTNGPLTIGGVVAMLLGSLMLYKPGSALEWVHIPRGIIFTVTAATALFFLFVAALGFRAQRAKVAIGPEAMLGEMAEVLQALQPDGTVSIKGEIWNARSTAGHVAAGATVRITAVKGLTLLVQPADLV